MRLIDADEIFNSINSFSELTEQRGLGKTIIPFAKQWIKFTVDNTPTIDLLDALGICRCKDCIYYLPNKYCYEPNGLNCPKETDYCSYAKRKEDNNV